jgi:hypothetical protein
VDSAGRAEERASPCVDKAEDTIVAGRVAEDRDADSLDSTEVDVTVDERNSFHAAALESLAAAEYGCSCRAIPPTQPALLSLLEVRYD